MEVEDIDLYLYEINRTPTRFYEYLQHLEDFFLLAGYKSDDLGEKKARLVAADAKTMTEMKKIPVENDLNYTRFVVVDSRIHRPFEAYMDLVEKVGHKYKSGKRTGRETREKLFRIRKVDKNFMTISVRYKSLLDIQKEKERKEEERERKERNVRELD